MITLSNNFNELSTINQYIELADNICSLRPFMRKNVTITLNTKRTNLHAKLMMLKRALRAYINHHARLIKSAYDLRRLYNSTSCGQWFNNMSAHNETMRDYRVVTSKCYARIQEDKDGEYITMSIKGSIPVKFYIQDNLYILRVN